MATVKELLRLEEVTHSMLLQPDGSIDTDATRLAAKAVAAQCRANTLTRNLQRYLEQRND